MLLVKVLAKEVSKGW